MEFDLRPEEISILKRMFYRGGVSAVEDLFLEDFMDRIEHCAEVGTTLHINFVNH